MRGILIGYDRVQQSRARSRETPNGGQERREVFHRRNSKLSRKEEAKKEKNRNAKSCFGCLNAQQ